VLSKQEQFLWIVQTTILANAINVTSGEVSEEYRTDISGNGVFIMMDEAVRASELIPDDMEVTEASDDFCTWVIKKWRDDAELGGKRLTVPGWFAR
jgi:hypothetical protein